MSNEQQLSAESLTSLPALMAWLRERHASLVSFGVKETYEGAIHAHIETLIRERDLYKFQAETNAKTVVAQANEIRKANTMLARHHSSDWCDSCEEVEKS